MKNVKRYFDNKCIDNMANEADLHVALIFDISKADASSSVSARLTLICKPAVDFGSCIVEWDETLPRLLLPS